MLRGLYLSTLEQSEHSIVRAGIFITKNSLAFFSWEPGSATHIGSISIDLLQLLLSEEQTDLGEVSAFLFESLQLDFVIVSLDCRDERVDLLLVLLLEDLTDLASRFCLESGDSWSMSEGFM